MKKSWKIAVPAMLVVLLGLVVVAGVAFAQDPEDDSAWPFNFGQKLHEAIAAVLGIGVDEYDAAVETARQQVLDEAVTEGWLTEEQAERMAEGDGLGGMRGGFLGRRGGMMGPGRGGMMGGTENSLLAVAADELGLTTDELAAELQDGKTIADLAGEKGVELQTIADAFIAQRAEWLAEAVAEGRMTQQQADWMLEQMEEEVLEHLSESLPFGGRGPGGCPGMRPGRFEGYPGTDES